jgi:pyrroloquinoline quinone biosynthesis protein D
MNSEMRPKLKPGVKLRHDPARGWVLMAPERYLALDETAHAIVRQCDGHQTIGDIVRTLSGEFDATPGEIEPDVVALLEELSEKGYVAL